MKNKKGFTLVELLAVIVVLAIIMIIAVPQVMTAMDNARANTFKIEVQKVIRAAMTQQSADDLTGVTTNRSVVTIANKTYHCYTLPKIGLGSDAATYKGIVLYGPVGTTTATWYIRLSDGNRMTKNAQNANTAIGSYLKNDGVGTMTNYVASTLTAAQLTALANCPA